MIHSKLNSLNASSKAQNEHDIYADGKWVYTTGQHCIRKGGNNRRQGIWVDLATLHSSIQGAIFCTPCALNYYPHCCFANRRLLLEYAFDSTDSINFAYSARNNNIDFSVWNLWNESEPIFTQSWSGDPCLACEACLRHTACAHYTFPFIPTSQPPL